MSMMCEVCKCTITLDEGCDNECSCCNGPSVESLIEERTAQLLSITEEQRDNDDESNPIIYAEHGPNRFAMMSLFFNDSDGVQITEDLELNEITVKFFSDSKEQELTTGPLYEWAIEFYKNNY